MAATEESLSSTADQIRTLSRTYATYFEVECPGDNFEAECPGDNLL